MASSTSQLRIAIIGGGPAGLVLLITLLNRGVPAILYERDAGFSVRSHLGGSLDLGYESGQRALRENGLEETFKRVSRPEGESFKMMDSHGNIFINQTGEEEKDPRDVRPEVDRTVLRKLMLGAVPADTVKWGHALSSVRPLGNGQHEVSFTNGTTIVTDVLVGADGAYSRVRPLVSAATPLYHGVTGVEISIAPEETASPDLKDLMDMIGKGSVYATENNRVLAAQVNGDGRIRTYAWHRAPEWTVPAEPAVVRSALLDIYTGWAPWLLKLIEHCDDAAIYPRALFYLPVGHTWAHVPGVTLVGDAAHLMSPFAGAGANLAMLDGLELGLALAKAINEGKGDAEREAALAAFEEKMLADAGKVAQIAMDNIEAIVNPNSPASALARAKAHKEHPQNRRTA